MSRRFFDYTRAHVAATVLQSMQQGFPYREIREDNSELPQNQIRLIIEDIDPDLANWFLVPPPAPRGTIDPKQYSYRHLFSPAFYAYVGSSNWLIERVSVVRKVQGKTIVCIIGRDISR